MTRRRRPIAGRMWLTGVDRAATLATLLRCLEGSVERAAATLRTLTRAPRREVAS